MAGHPFHTAEESEQERRKGNSVCMLNQAGVADSLVKATQIEKESYTMLRNTMGALILDEAAHCDV